MPYRVERTHTENPSKDFLTIVSDTGIMWAVSQRETIKTLASRGIVGADAIQILKQIEELKVGIAHLNGKGK